MRRWTLVVLFGISLAFALGCGDDSGDKEDAAITDTVQDDVDRTDTLVKCDLQVTRIGDRAPDEISQIGPNLDKDPATPGYQMDIRVELSAGSDRPVSLSVTGLDPNPTADSASRVATFVDVTIDSDIGIVQITPQAANCAGQTLTYSVQPAPSCSFELQDGTTLRGDDDEAPEDPAFKYNILIVTKNAVQPVDSASRSEISLVVDADSQIPDRIDPPIEVTQDPIIFNLVELDAKEGIRLLAELTVGGAEVTCETTINVDVDGPSCTIVGLSPAPIPAEDLPGLGVAGLGPQQDEDGDPSNGVQTNVTIQTSSDAVKVELREGGRALPLGSTTDIPTDGKVTFKLGLSDESQLTSGLNALRAVCLDDQSNRTETRPTSVFVDTNPPPKVTSPNLVCEVRCLGNAACDGNAEVSHNRQGIITCTWPPVSDGPQGSGIAGYILGHRLLDAPGNEIDQDNWDDASTTKVQLAALAQPIERVPSLRIPNSYTFAVKSVDRLGNVSDISDVPAAVKVDFNRQNFVGNPRDALGFPMVVGDFNCDGLSDVAVGIAERDLWVDDNGNQVKDPEEITAAKAGEVQLFFGEGTGLPDSFSVRIVGTRANQRLGQRLAALDYDNDDNGCTDLAVMASGAADPQRAFLYLGRSGLQWTDRDDSLDDGGTGAEIVYNFAGSEGLVTLAAEDLDNDGYDDLAISHRATDTGATTIYIDHGEPGVPLVSPGTAPMQISPMASSDSKIIGGQNAEWFGAPMAPGGRLDDDAYGDLLVGSFQQKASSEPGAATVGGVYVIRGGPRVAQIDITTSDPRVINVRGSTNNDSFGLSLGAVGDVDDDGAPEFVVGDPFAAGRAGAAYVFDLAGDLPQTAEDADLTISNDFDPNTENLLGRSVASAVDVDPVRGADLNGDGIGDMLIGLSQTGAGVFGSAALILGKEFQQDDFPVSQSDVLVTDPDASPAYSLSTALVADINGDGFVDVLIGDHFFPDGSVKAGRLQLLY